MTPEQKAASYDTMQHIHEVGKNLHLFAKELLDRADRHDLSKLESPELEIFTTATEKLSRLEYGTPEYEQSRLALGEALSHHYSVNRHHPEYFIGGIADMTLVDVVEMLCDWAAAVRRHKNSDLLKSLEINVQRFGISEQMASVLRQTILTYYKKETSIA